MIAEQLLAELSQKGIELWADGDRLNYRAAAGLMSPQLKEQLREHKAHLLEVLRRREGAILPDPAQRHEAFPLTEVQQAYWLGRDAAHELGNVAAHSYVECEFDHLDLPRLERALNRLIERHDMLRAIVLPDGMQRILPQVPWYRIATSQTGLRERMSHQVRPADRWPLFEIQATVLAGGRTRLHISLDLLIADAASVLLLVRECVNLYRDPAALAQPIGLSFRDYVLADAVFRKRDPEAWRRSFEWWQARLADLPPHPALPLARESGSIGRPRFVRRGGRIEPDVWQRLKARAAAAGVTPSMLLCTAYAEVLAAWSSEPRFTLNLTLFNRLPRHPDVEQLVGDFTSGVLLEVDCTGDTEFTARARAVQDRLWKDVEHARVSSVQVLRELARTAGAGRAAMPVVFTSLLQAGGEDRDWSRHVLFGVSQTPQVWLDHQVFELGGALVFNWDAVEELFPAGLLNDMFAAYVALLEKLAAGGERVDLLPARQHASRAAVNATDGPLSDARLEELFLRAASDQPDAPAVIASERTLTYAELERASGQLSHRLTAAGIGPGDLVAVVMRKGWEQVVAALAILRAGAAYVPFAASLPPERLCHLLEQSGARLALAESALGGELPPLNPGVEHAPPGLAYVIYTSGSTGEPKGVMIDHRGAVNTILDINRRFAIGPEDRVLGLSSMSFDLSVYDIFGMLAAGGALVLPEPDANRDPRRWAELIATERVTVWNSVPALMEILAEHLETTGEALAPALRLAMLSGDWIPLTLPGRIARLAPGTRVVSLGGATEGSIWSILFPIEDVRPEWKSIPYGRPMTNQRFHVLNPSMRDCPDWVPGELYIGGAGVAMGYWRDPEKTRDRFPRHPVTGERLYRTGDLGRYLPDGNIEFLGRNDGQVKIHGHRIELGEIEAALRRHPAVHEAVVTAPGPREHRRLVAHVVPAHPQSTDSAPQFPDLTKSDCALPADALRRIRDFTAQLDRASTLAICATLRRLGAFAEAGEARCVSTIPEIAATRRVVMEQWLDALAADGLLHREDRETFRAPAPLPAAVDGEMWNALAADPFAGRELIDYFRRCYTAHAALLADRINPLELLFPGGSWATAERLYQSNPAAAYINRVAAGVVKTWAASRSGNLRVLEVGAGTGGTTASLFDVLPAERCAYTYSDVSPFFRSGARHKFASRANLEFALFDINKEAAEQRFPTVPYDAIVAANVLHGAHDIPRSLGILRGLLAPGGLLVLVEGTAYPRYLMASATGFLEGLGVPSSDDATARPPLLSLAEWNRVLDEAGFRTTAVLPHPGAPESALGLHVIACWNPAAGCAASLPDADGLRAFLRRTLPDYMVPGGFAILDKLPLTANGKVDRAALSTVAPAVPVMADAAPETEHERTLARIWSDLLNLTAVGAGANFFELGGDSLVAVQLNARLRRELKVELPLRAIFENPRLRDLAAAIQREGRAISAESALPRILSDPARRYEPFPLTGVQQAYWIGRMSPLELGNVPCQVYLEFEGAGWDLDRLGRAWQMLIERHPMLRAEFLADGTQRVREAVPPFEFVVADLRGIPATHAEAALLATREEMAYANRDVRSWPLFDIRASRIEAGRIRLHVCVEALIADGWSLFCLFRDWDRFYRSPESAPPPLEISFRDYVLAQEAVRGTPAWAESESYWNARLDDFPEAPKLPLAANPESIHSPRFRRRLDRLSPDEWQHVAAAAQHLGLTPSNVLAAAYSEVLAAWSASARFALNVTQFNRLPLHAEVDALVGDFTSLTLLEIDCRATGSFADGARRLQTQLANDMDHPYGGGIDFIRRLAQKRGGPRALMPVVFTSLLSFGGLEGSAGDAPNGFGTAVFSVSQTPQVWLDHQVWEEDGGLMLSWDAIDELFPAGMLDDMFAAYTGLLRTLSHAETVWTAPLEPLIPASHVRVQDEANSTAATLSRECLHSLVRAQAEHRPERPAVISADRTLTYGELWRLAAGLATALRHRGVGPDTHAAIVMEKGWEQVVAVLGTLIAGGAYLPIDPALPAERVRHLLSHGEARVILTQAKFASRPEFPEAVAVLTAADAESAGSEPIALPESLAYTIYTSGSTGLPKGVAIEHRGTVNTILDINRRFAIGPDDRILALSSLSFDLSVYDIFGALAAGAAIVMPPPSAQRDPAEWLRLIAQERCTVWNSVPALMRMLVEYAAGSGRRCPDSLRLALLSGDWIPVALPPRIRAFAPRAEIVSLGGATEASIWSILYPIGEIDPAWPSIPYGKPMANQRFYVLDERLNRRPTWAPGSLYIAGEGVAREYWRDPEKTAASFLRHPQTGERLYRTGDLGRYLPDGNIEFLGREDFQVKVQGYRVEPGEIEAALEAHPKVRSAAVAATGDPRGDKRLVAYVVPEVEPGAAERLEFKLRQPGLRRDLDGLPSLALDSSTDDRAPFLARRTQRRFAPEPIEIAQLSHLLAALRQVSLDGTGFHKYRYPSAGDLYPVQTYVYCKPNRVRNTEAGLYYHDPVEHRLVLLSAGTLDRDVHLAPNRAIFDDAAFSIHLVAEMQAIEPLYGPLARDFCLLEAGYMSELLMIVAGETGIGLCPIGDLRFEPIRDLGRLGSGRIHLHALLGGRQEPAAERPYEPSAPRVANTGGLEEVLTEELRTWLRARLPEYMVPAAFAIRQELPLTSNGKVDRTALSRESLTPATSTPFRPPATHLERTIAAVVCDVLRVEKVGIYDNFFEAGATSIQLVRIGTALGARLGRDVPVVQLFTNPTIDALARCLADAAPPPAPAAEDIRERARKQRESFQRPRPKRER